jgi:hypothetical protein
MFWRREKVLSLLTFEPLRSSSPQTSHNASFPVPVPFFGYILSLNVTTGKNLQAPHMASTAATQRDPSNHATGRSLIKKKNKKAKHAAIPIL